MSNARPVDIFNLCQFKFANGRLCGLPAHPKHDGLCLAHARAASLKPPPRDDDLSAELASPAGDFITQIDINHVLGNLFSALAANRVSPRRASSLAYIAFLLLQSQEGAKDEARRWNLDLPTYQKLLKLKYPKGHPFYPKTPEKDTAAKPPAQPPDHPSAKAPVQPHTKPAAKSAAKSSPQPSARPTPPPPARRSARASAESSARPQAKLSARPASKFRGQPLSKNPAQTAVQPPPPLSAQPPVALPEQPASKPSVSPRAPFLTQPSADNHNKHSSA